MSWQDRPYSQDDDTGNVGFAGGGHHREGFRSWFGGLPGPGRAVKAILLANVAMFILCKLTGSEESPIFRGLALYVDDVIYRFQVWRLITFSYLHDQRELFHILFNMIGLYFLGIMLESRWGPKKFFVFYTAGSLAGVVMYMGLALAGWLPSSIMGIPISLVGASGGVLALLGACAVLFPHVRVILLFFPVPIRLACALFVILYTWNLVHQGPNAGGDACHLAGLAFGIYWGYRGERWFRKFDQWESGRERRQWESKRRDALDLEARVDRILEKVRQQGMQSLTREEKRTLENATRAKQTSGPRR